MDIDAKRVLSYLLLAIIVVSIVAVAAHTVGPFEVAVNDGAKFNASGSGPTIWFGSDVDIESGNPFVDANTINISTDQGIVNVSSTAATEAQFDTVNGTWTNVSQVSASAGNLTINPHDKNASTVGGAITAYRFRSMSVDDEEVDLVYSATGTGTIIVNTNATQGTQYGLVNDDTNEGIDVAIAGADGQVTFTEVSSGTLVSTRIQELGSLDIRDELPPHASISGQVVSLTFYENVDDDPVIEDLSTSTGTVDLTGLPVDKSFSVAVNTSGYHNRTVLVDDLSQQDTIFLLNESASSVENRFTVDDRTGEFPVEDTKIVIQRAINQSIYDSGGFAWITVSGDDLGADEALVANLQLDHRYRIRVENDDGDTRILGAYTAATAGTINLVIGRVVLDPTGTAQPETEVIYNDSVNPRTIKFEYNDSEEETTEIFLRIYEFNNASNELLANTSFTPGGGNFGTFSNTETVPAAQNNTTWVVEFHIVRTGEDDIDGRRIVGPQGDIFPDLPAWLVTIVFIGTVLVVGGLFSRLNGHVGGLIIAGMGALFWFTGVAPPYLGGGVVALSMIAAGVIFVNESRGGL